MSDKAPETPPTVPPNPDILKDLGAELASLRVDFEKTKNPNEMEAIKAEIGKIKIAIQAFGAGAEEDYAGYWRGMFE